jgi:hypothetical protein
VTHKLLQSALRGKAPIVAIPIEGHAPFCINRVLLAKWAKGVEIIGVEVRENRWLTIHGQAGRVKTRCSFPAIPPHKARLEIGRWSDRERKARQRVIAQGATNTKEFRAAERAAKLKAIEADQPEFAALDAARYEMASVKAEIVRNLFPRYTQYGNGGFNPKWEKERLLERFSAWRAGKRARGIQGKRERERRPELAAIDAEYARIVPPHRGKGSKRRMTEQERACAQELRRQHEAIWSYIEFEASWDYEIWGNPAKEAREPRRGYGEPKPRLELAKALVAAKRRLAEAEHMMRLFEVEKAAIAAGVEG